MEVFDIKKSTPTERGKRLIDLHSARDAICREFNEARDKAVVEITMGIELIVAYMGMPRHGR